MTSPTLFSAVPPGIAPPDGSFRRWSADRGWVPVFEAEPFDAPGFEDVPLFTGVVHVSGRVGFGAFEGRTGEHLSDFAWPSRPLAVSDAREILRIKGRALFDQAVAVVLAKREANRG